MEEKNLQEQIGEINRKMDCLLEFVEQQNRKREELDDLIEDASIVAKDAFKQSVVLLDKAQVEFDPGGISNLIIKVLQNLGTFHEMLNMMESAKDFLKDITPVLHQVGLDAVNKMNEFDNKGYFQYISALTEFIEKWIWVFTVEDLKKMEANIENLAGILRNLSDPSLINGFNNITRALSTVKPDDKIDDQSLWKILLHLKSPEVRKSLSWSLRLIKEINK